MSADPVRAADSRKRAVNYTIPPIHTVTVDTTPAPAVDGLTPGALPAGYTEPTPADSFARFLADSRDGVYGA